MCTQAQANDTTIALGIWKRYLPNTELDRPDILGKLYKEFGSYKFTNLVEEAGAVGVGNIAELVNLYGKMQHSGDIRWPRAKRLELGY